MLRIPFRISSARRSILVETDLREIDLEAADFFCADLQRAFIDQIVTSEDKVEHERIKEDALRRLAVLGNEVEIRNLDATEGFDGKCRPPWRCLCKAIANNFFQSD